MSTETTDPSGPIARIRKRIVNLRPSLAGTEVALWQTVLTIIDTEAEAVLAVGLCIWEGRFLDHPGRYICDLPQDAFAHAHSATCPPEHAPSWECHTYQPAAVGAAPVAR